MNEKKLGDSLRQSAERIETSPAPISSMIGNERRRTLLQRTWAIASVASICVVLSVVATTGTFGGTGRAAEPVPLTNQSACDWTQNAAGLDPRLVTSVFDANLNYSGFLEPDRWMQKPEIKMIAVGRVIDFVDAETRDSTDRAPGPTTGTTLMHVQLTDVAKGQAPTDDEIWMRLRFVQNTNDARAALPTGTVVALYLERYDGPRLASLSDPGFPENDNLFENDTLLYDESPIGFVAADGPNGGVIFPTLGEVLPDRTFESQLPASALARCSEPANTPIPAVESNSVEGEWQATALVGGDGQSLLTGRYLNGEAQIDLTFTRGQLTGHTGCNSIFGTYREVGERDLTFPHDRLGTTQVGCSDEPPLIQRLLEVRHISGKGAVRYLHAENWMIIAQLERVPATK